MCVYDVIVVGAGPGGSSAAYYLARMGLDVLLLDKASFPRDKTCGDGLTPRALHALAEMGIELGGLSARDERINAVWVTAPDGGQVQVRVPAAQRWPNYMCVLPRYLLDDLILERARSAGAHFESRVHATGVRQEQRWVIVTGRETGIVYRGRVAILATGASTALLRQSGLLRRQPPVALAARAYFELRNPLVAPEEMQFRFDGLPPPGYGWIFPLSASSANIGVAQYPRGGLRRWPNRTAAPRSLLEPFINSPGVKALLGADLQRRGPLQGFPIRMDFPYARTATGRVLAVGEAAGLVNPLTGDGIDFALESGRFAAEEVGSFFRRGDSSRRALDGYPRRLRREYGELFVISHALKRLLAYPAAMNWLVKEAARRPLLARGLARIILGPEKPSRLARALLRDLGADVRNFP